ncbi:hypothetical protein EB230_21010 [Mesorhizobium sp. NZP2234]|nr:hypothetical protein EB230_21010 [Mesorhizobium sp. NZP2234]
MERPHRIGGTTVQHTGKLFEMLHTLYANTDAECNIGISFNQGADGAQNNPCRSLVLDYVRTPSLATGRAIARRLASYTTKRSGLGLVFLLLGTEGRARKVVLSRFPAHNAILADEDQNNLNVQFLERVFMRNAKAFKAAAYQDVSLDTGFWVGRAVDKQVESRELDVSDYWIRKFLDSEFVTTAALGTRRIATALRDAARKTTDLGVKNEIVAAVTLGAGLDGQNMTVLGFEDRFGLSAAAREAIAREISAPRLAEEMFRFDAEEFARQVPYRTVELDSGAILTAQATEFNEVFTQETVIKGGTRAVRFSAVGRVVDQKLERTK